VAFTDPSGIMTEDGGSHRRRRGGASPRWRLRFGLVLASLLLCWLTPRVVEACACCDGRGDVDLLGWSTDGRELLLRHTERVACERHVRLEVYGSGSSSPSRCYDLLGDPEASVPCNSVQSGYQSPAQSRHTQDFPVRIRSLSPRGLAATAAISMDGAFRRATVRVSWLGSAPERTLATTVVHEYSYWSPADGELTELAPIEVAVLLPEAEAREAALFIRGVDTMPGIGHRAWRLQWLELPPGLPAEPGVHWVRAVDEYDSPPHDEASRSRGENAVGLRALKGGDLAAARGHFEQALAFDPRYVLARYNLACALARLGLPHHAWRQLDVVLSRPPPTVRAERRARALGDGDLTALRDLPEFRARVGVVTAELPAASASTSARTGTSAPGPSSFARQSALAPLAGSAGPAASAPAAAVPAPRGPGCGCRTGGARPTSERSAWVLLAVMLVLRRRRRFR
jgi:MYXO-CTERM domain-containing protein